MSRLEYFRVFHSQANQLGNIKETPIIQFLRRETPKAEPVILGFEQVLQRGWGCYVYVSIIPLKHFGNSILRDLLFYGQTRSGTQGESAIVVFDRKSIVFEDQLNLSIFNELLTFILQHR